MNSRNLTFKVDFNVKQGPEYGKKSFGALKNQNSQDFSLKNQHEVSVLPKVKSVKPFARNQNLAKNPENPIDTHRNRSTRLEKIRKMVNQKIFQESHIKVPPPAPALLHIFTSPPIRKISPEKFKDSVSYTKADLNVKSKFVPTDRNTDNYVTSFWENPKFPEQFFTKNSPKVHKISNIF